MTAEDMEFLVEKHMDAVFQFCCFLTGSRSEGEELCQDTFLKAVELRHRLDCSDKSANQMRNYFIGIAVNLWKNQRRKYYRRQRIAPSESWEEAALLHVSDGKVLEEQVVKHEMMREIQLEIQKLPDKQRIVVNLRFGGSLEVGEIAEVLHIPKETVKSRLRLAKQKIRKGMEVRGYEFR